MYLYPITIYLDTPKHPNMTYVEYLTSTTQASFQVDEICSKYDIGFGVSASWECI